jgi:hypothetical protein
MKRKEPDSRQEMSNHKGQYYGDSVLDPESYLLTPVHSTRVTVTVTMVST